MIVSSIKSLFIGPFAWLSNLWFDSKQWLIVNRVVKNGNNAKMIADKGLKVDWIGRLYTVIKVPEEIAYNEMERDAYVMSQVREYTELTMKLRIAEMVFPEVIYERDESGAPMVESPILVLAGPQESFQTWTIIANFFKFLILGILFRAAWMVFFYTTYGESVAAWSKEAFNFLF